MRFVRPLRAIASAGMFLLVLVALALSVALIDEPVPALMVLALALLAVLGSRLAARHIPKGTVLEIDMDKTVVENRTTNPLDRALSPGAVVLRDIVDSLDRAAEDRRVVGVVARVGNGKLGIAVAQELRDAVKRFRRSGKRTVAYSETFGEGRLAIVDFYLATAFDEIHLQRTGAVGIEGVIARVPFLGRFFERYGAVPDLDHREEYKSAKYRLTESEFVEPHREESQAILDDHFDQIVEGIAADREMEPERVRALIDNAPLTGPGAVDGGLIDHLSYRGVAYEAAKGDEGRSFLFSERYLKKAGRPHRRGERIGLIYGTGSINRGSSRFDPLTMSSSMGADEVTWAFREAIDDEKVKAIVFRVDSPGGSAVASDLIGHEVGRAREAGKPVVVSMGNLAGSGGYWISAPADHIVAQPGTLTGSIGVVSGKLAFGEAFGRVGVDLAELHVGKNATTWDSIRPFSDSERERNGVFLDWIYEDFLAHVAKNRSMKVEEVRLVAKGRVWTGKRALDHELVDGLGGLHEAIEVARELAAIGRDKRLQVRVYPQPRTLPLPKRKESSEPVEAVIGSIVSAFEGFGGLAGKGYELMMPMH